MGWHYIEFIRVQCFHRKGSTRVQHVEVSQTFTKWSNCCIHRGYVLSWLSLKMYSGDFHGREAILIFSTCWKFSVPVIVSEHYDCASGGNSCGMCFQFHFLRFVPYEFRIPDKRIQNNQTNMSHNVTYTYIYIHVHVYDKYFVGCQIQIQSENPPIPWCIANHALTFFGGGVAKVQKTAIPSCQIITPKMLVLYVVFFCFSATILLQKKNLLYPCRQSTDLFCKQVSWSVVCGSLQLCLTCNAHLFHRVLSTWNVSPC